MKSAFRKESTSTVQKPATIVSPKPVQLPDAMRERIAQRAYELWELRGRRHGHALQDWLDAEILVLDEIHEARQ
ncbi:DUF2934 domain-containing protein [Nitrospira sp. Nam80]